MNSYDNISNHANITSSNNKSLESTKTPSNSSKHNDLIKVCKMDLPKDYEATYEDLVLNSECKSFTFLTF